MLNLPSVDAKQPNANKSTRSIRLGIDCRLAGNRHAGIGRYIQQLAVRVPFLLPKWDLIFTVAELEQQQALEKHWDEQGKKPRNVSFVVAPIQHYTLAEQLKMPKIFAQQNLDILHVPHFNIPLLYTGKIIITIHDLLWHEHRGSEVTTLPKWLYWFKYIGYRWVVTTALRRALAIIVPSHTIKDTLSKYFPHTLQKIFVTYEGADQFNGKASKKPQLNWQRNPQRLLYVGSLYPHKNITVVLQALQLNPELTLDLVGSRSVFQDRVKAEIEVRGISDKVTWHGHLSDADLEALTKKVTALIQPSLSEGFGLTGLEAMTQGVPLLASDIPIFREIYQEGAWYFDPHDPTSLLNTVQNMTPKACQEKLELASNRAHTFSWQQMSEETTSIYQQTL